MSSNRSEKDLKKEREKATAYTPLFSKKIEPKALVSSLQNLNSQIEAIKGKLKQMMVHFQNNPNEEKIKSGVDDLLLQIKAFEEIIGKYKNILDSHQEDDLMDGVEWAIQDVHKKLQAFPKAVIESAKIADNMIHTEEVKTNLEKLKTSFENLKLVEDQSEPYSPPKMSGS